MKQSHSNRIKDFFEVHSRDVTPVPVCDTAHVLYVPVSNDPEITACCASVLSATELQRAERFIGQGDRSLFIQRRAFRRFCGALLLGSSKSLSKIAIDQTESGRPYLFDLPQISFSFSSCRFGFLGAWSSMHGVGVDIEDRTRDPGATALAREFFPAAEARAVEGDDGVASLRSFFHLWSLKEAALKSIGEGLPYGLNAFEFELDPNLRIVEAPSDHGGPERFSAHVIEGTESCAAVVIHYSLV